MSALLVYFPSALIQDLRQANADYPTMYIYGEKGFRQTLDYLKPQSCRNSLFICRKDLAAYLKISFYFDYILLEPEKLDKLLDSKKIDFIVFSDCAKYLPNQQLEIVLDRRCKFIKKFGDFNIYAPKGS